MSKTIKVLFLSAEVTPIAKLGGLADVAGALPKALADLGVDIRIALPFYGLIDRKKYPAKKIANGIAVPFAGREEKINLWETSLPETKIPVYLIEHPFFDSKEIYQTHRYDNKEGYTRGPADIERFSFFTRASLEAVKKINFQPDIIHANDWHMGLAADFVQTLNEADDFFKNTKIIFTIHNLANQGLADAKIIKLSGIDPDLKTVKDDLKNKDLIMMVQGIMSSDIVNTVSPTYAKEILTKEYGAGLKNVLALKKKRLYGILNGVDTDFFNPETDKLIAKNYSSSNLEKRSANKLALQKKLGFKPDKNMALAGLVTRFVGQKGLDLIIENFAGAISANGAGGHESPLPCQFVFLGTGEEHYEQELLELAKKFPNSLNVQIKFDEQLAHEIYAGSDIFLVPSRFEPCGLTQMIAMRYGSVPLVRSTGGLKDTVTPLYLPPLTKGDEGGFNVPLPASPAGGLTKEGLGEVNISPTGFVFKKFSANEFYKTLNTALDIYCHHPETWRELQLNGMTKDFSWKKSAKEYLKLYKKMSQ